METKPIGDIFGDYLEKLREKKKTATIKNGVQSTEHQHLAIETATVLEDLSSKAIYFRIFKKHYRNKEALLKCRQWVLSRQNCTNRGRLFVSTYKKFLSTFDDTKKSATVR